jgi:hypothetical protein
MACFVWTNYSIDGTHTRTFRSEKTAIAALVKFLGRADDCGEAICVGKSFYDNYGARQFIEERVTYVTAKQEDAQRRAFDARECGTATKRQLALLEKNYL